MMLYQDTQVQHMLLGKRWSRSRNKEIIDDKNILSVCDNMAIILYIYTQNVIIIIITIIIIIIILRIILRP